jgi:hypothetical protein
MNVNAECASAKAKDLLVRYLLDVKTRVTRPDKRDEIASIVDLIVEASIEEVIDRLTDYAVFPDIAEDATPPRLKCDWCGRVSYAPQNDGISCRSPVYGWNNSVVCHGTLRPYTEFYLSDTH